VSSVGAVAVVGVGVRRSVEPVWVVEGVSMRGGDGEIEVSMVGEGLCGFCV